MSTKTYSFYCQCCKQNFDIKAETYKDMMRLRANGCPTCGCVNVVTVSGRLLGWVPRLFKSDKKKGQI